MDSCRAEGRRALERTGTAIIGGGIVGCSIAYHLARHGDRDVTVIEREPFVGAGSTSKAAGGIRQQFSTRTNIALSALSVPRFRQLGDELGVPFTFHEAGYLFLATTPDRWQTLQDLQRLQASLGVPTRLLTPADVRDIAPPLRTDDLLGGSFCPTDGYGDPYQAVTGFARRARDLGATVVTGCTVVGLTPVAGGWRVDSDGGPLAADRVVIAAGAHSGQIGRLAGVNIPVQPYRRQLYVTEPVPAIGRRLPMVVDESGVYFRSEAGGVLFGMTDPDEPSSFNTTVNDEWTPVVVERLVERMPLLATVGIRNSWAGLYEVTPDHHCILGAVPGHLGLYVAAGFSGHGFMQSPAAGQLMAELLLDGQTSSLDISPLALDRFTRGELLVEKAVI